MSETVFANQDQIAEKWTAELAQLQRDHAAALAAGKSGVATSISAKMRGVRNAIDKLTRKGASIR